MRRAAIVLLHLLGAAACCYLGLLCSRLLWETPRFLIALAPGSEFHGLQVWGLTPRFLIYGPVGMSVLGNAALAATSLLIGLVALRFGPALSERLTGWSRLLVFFTVFWLGVLVADAAVYFAVHARGPVRTVLQSVMPPNWGAPVPGVILLIALASSVFVVLGRMSGDFPPAADPAFWKRCAAGLLWVVLPVLALNLAQGRTPITFGFWRTGWLLAPSVLALGAVLPALWKGRTPKGVFEPRWKGVFGLILGSVAVYVGLSQYPELVRHRQAAAMEPFTSRYWDLRFEPGQFTPAQKRKWSGAADARLEALAKRVGINIAPKQRVALVHVTSRSKQTAEPERRNDSPYVLESSQILHHFLSPSRTLAGPRGEALLLMAGEWGEPGSQAVARALARYAVGDFLGHSLPTYARRIACEERPYMLREILRVDRDYRSPLMRDAMSGAWIHSLVDERGLSILRGPLRVAA